MTELTGAAIKSLTKEFAYLSAQPPEGIKLLLNDGNISEIQAWIQGPDGTPFSGGSFKVKLILPSEFPSVPPKGFFITKIFHPNVSKVGEICVSTLKKDWKKELGIGHVLLTIKCLLIAPNAESALNEEAGRLLLEDYNAYAKHAQLMTTIHANQKIDFGKENQSVDSDSEEIVNLSLNPEVEAVGHLSMPASSALIGTEILGINNLSSNIANKKRVGDKVVEKEKTDKKKSMRRL